MAIQDNLPQDWAAYTAAQKIEHLNNIGATVADLTAAGVSPSDIQYMQNNGFNSAARPVAASSQPASGVRPATSTPVPTPEALPVSVQFPGANLPSNWSAYSPQQKIEYFNANGTTPDQMKKYGATDTDFEWMRNNGWKDPTRPAATVTPTALTPTEVPGTTVGNPNLPGIAAPQAQAQPAFNTPVLNALYGAQQQRMFSSAPTFNFASGRNTPATLPAGAGGPAPTVQGPLTQVTQPVPEYNGYGGPLPSSMYQTGGPMEGLPEELRFGSSPGVAAGPSAPWQTGGPMEGLPTPVAAAPSVISLNPVSASAPKYVNGVPQYPAGALTQAIQGR